MLQEQPAQSVQISLEEIHNIVQKQQPVQQYIEQKIPLKSVLCSSRVLTDHWLTLSRPQYKRTCGISALISVWNYQFSRLGLGDKQPLTIQQAMLKLNLIGNDSVSETYRKKFKKTKELTDKNQEIANNTETNNDKVENKGEEKQQTNNQEGNKSENTQNTQNQGKTKQQKQDEKLQELNKEEKDDRNIQKKQQVNIEQEEDPQITNNDKTLHQYVNSIDFGCFTGNDTLLKWYRLLCRLQGVSGRSSIFYKTNSQRSSHKDQLSAKRALIQKFNQGGKTCFIYHAYDHYFCPVGYQYTPQQQSETLQEQFESENIRLQDDLCVLVGQSSKMFPCFHSFDWNNIQLDLSTYWPKKYNIRRPKQGVTIVKGKQQAQPKKTTINCIMAFEKLRD